MERRYFAHYGRTSRSARYAGLLSFRVRKVIAHILNECETSQEASRSARYAARTSSSARYAGLLSFRVRKVIAHILNECETSQEAILIVLDLERND